MNNMLTALYSTPQRMYVGQELAFQVITPRGPAVMPSSEVTSEVTRPYGKGDVRAKKNKLISPKTITAAGLATLVALATLSETGRDISHKALRTGGNILDNAIYGQDVTSKRYTQVSYEIKPTDDQETLKAMVGNDPMAWDYIVIANDGVRNLKPGKIVKIPRPSDSGKTLPELFAELGK